MVRGTRELSKMRCGLTKCNPGYENDISIAASQSSNRAILYDLDTETRPVVCQNIDVASDKLDAVLKSGWPWVFQSGVMVRSLVGVFG